MPYVHLALPTALILWLALWPMRGRARAVHAAMTIAIVAAIVLSVQWLWPSAYAPLGLFALLALAILLGRRRPVARHHTARIWPTVLASLVTLAAATLATGLVTARLRPTTTVDLTTPFAGAVAITEGGARQMINRHRAVLDPASPSLTSWRGTGQATTLQPVDSWGRPFATAQPVLAPCAGTIAASGTDPRLGPYALLACSGSVIGLSGLTTLTATGPGPVTQGQPLGTATSLTLHAQTPGTTAHPFSGAPLWISLSGTFPVRAWVLRP